ncbi:DUF6090 family protein [Flagellimonas zhangzhouensis]|uniref:Uncharacterized protein n=1 Tax=Flagellimonas zhangzhouensis TaxID=1073328 RepID=A0A1H2S6V9_9FLAO|nr:DUF6090 family protein [Allomuricauda zhangzhouensis]SDQ71445.1 hypothetical protein SAMN05216294_2310 [Allomuricauda zhangzhouensis]SDW27397.1 hypothetical protein SAMN04487892_0957 [Allomuricauda zhangzhouensis]
MLQFFRKIRQNLLSEGKTGKYLTYAIGEIVLVVIGILIALQINNWNDNIKKSKLEQETLYNLKGDFELNKAELEGVIKAMESNIDKSVEILNFTGNKDSDNFLLDSLLIATVSGPVFDAQNGFLNDLISSGNLGILKNVELRSKLSSWEPNLEKLARKEGYMEEAESDVIQFVIKNGSWLNVDNFNLSKSKTNLKIPKSGFVVSNNTMLSSLEFENLVENSVVYYNITLTSQKEILKLINEILDLIQLEMQSQN